VRWRGCAGRATLTGMRLIVGVALLLMTAHSAWARCALPDPSVVWSSPAAGAVDVPVDADLLILTETIDPASTEVTLLVDGLIELPLEAGSALPGHYDLPELEPNQAQTIVLRPEGGTPITIGFTTGERRASDEGGALDLVDVSQQQYAQELVESGLCSDVLFRNTCFDTGIPWLQTFAIDAGAAPVAEASLWAIETLSIGLEPWLQFWPAACGTPHGWGLRASAQYRLYNIGENGVIRESNVLEHVVEQPPPPPTPNLAQSDANPSGGIGCSVSVEHTPAAPSFVAAAALALTALWRRRRARSR
jgi:MYXO-CTERM domain-containing protein